MILIAEGTGKGDRGWHICRILGHICIALHHMNVLYIYKHARCFSVKVIAAEGEQKASKALREASIVMAESSSALQLRYLQVYTQS